MSGSITVGGKILASHDNVSGKLSMSGDVDMSNMVFPTGHIGIKSYSITNNNYWSGNATSETELFIGSGGFTSEVITPTSTNSKFLIIGFFGSATTAQTNLK
jgi:hypothetical protein